MSRIYKDKNNLSKKQPDYLEELTGRATTSFNERKYSERILENQAIQENDVTDDWAENQSPLTGRMSGTMEELERIQSSEMMAVNEVQQCLKDSLDCYQSCTETIMQCLPLGGKYAKVGHINLLMDCANICNTNATFILRKSTYYPQTCGICADICDECGDNCDQFEDDFLKECAQVCRHCAESCREMA